MIVAEITKEKADSLIGEEYISGVKFNPILLTKCWVISLTEAQYLKSADIVSLIDYIQEEGEDVNF